MPTWRDPLTLPHSLSPRGDTFSRDAVRREARDHSQERDVEQMDAETRAFFGPKPSPGFRQTVWTMVAAAAAIGIARMLLVAIH